VADLTLIREVEQAALRAWPALEQCDEAGWLVRLAGGYTKRANSITALQPCAPASEAQVALCEALYRERGLPPIFRLVEPLAPEGLDDLLARRGYGVVEPSLVLAAPLSALGIAQPRHPLCIEHDIESWLAAYQAVSGSALPQAAHGRILAAIAGRVQLATIRQEGAPVACALAVAEGAYVGLYDLAVAPAWRRQGLGRALVMGLLRWGCDAGAAWAYLQVVEANAVARALYEGLGFQRLYGYWYRVGTVGPTG
jgi:ribosomal protein S18 acetylase RimI-like enzyme